MSNQTPDPPTPNPGPGEQPAGGLLSRLKNAFSPAPAEEPAREAMPGWDTVPEVEDTPPAPDIPLAMPVLLPDPLAPLALPVNPEDIPLALPIEAEEVGVPPEALPLAQLLELDELAVPEPAVAPQEEAAVAEPSTAPAAPAAPERITCPVCASCAPFGEPYCSDCGYHFSEADLAAAMPQVAAVPAEAAPASPAAPAGRLQGRYELGELISERRGVQRYRGLDHGTPNGKPGAVFIIRQPLAAEPVPPPAPVKQADSPDEILPTFDDLEATAFPNTEVITIHPDWPSITWERRLLRTLEHPALPGELDYFCDDEYEYLVEEAPTGKLLWDAWDDPDTDCKQKFGYLVSVAETLHRLHQCNAILEGLRPEIVVVDAGGRLRFSDLSDLLPLPLPLGVQVRGGLYTAPELLKGQGDARADLYSFGAMLYALHVGRELNPATDFDGPGNPKPFIPRFPDIHPAFGRLMMKTFRKEVEARFPTDEASREDSTGFLELIRTLETLRRTYDNVRLEVASWTSTGIVRTGNEDAYCVLHACESRQDDLGEAALVILCDGMGGYEAGEIAAALTIQSLRKQLSQLPPFNLAAGATPFVTDPLTQMSRPEGHVGPGVVVQAVKQAIKQALRDAYKLVFQTSRAPGSKRRGMGCTAEVVYIDGRNVVVGHVGDSRVYQLREGRLIQLTRDQTLVNRLVELGTLTPEEAETHPRRNELQQAIGGQPDVEPGLYHGRMGPGDWVVVCSDGLSNHVSAHDLQQMLQSEATSAEMAARRLVNLTLIEGATDNVTVVAVRAT